MTDLSNDNRNLNAAATLGDIADVVLPISEAIATLGKRVSELNRSLDRFTLHEAKIAELESRGSFEYRGVFQDGQCYQKGDFVTQSGSLFACKSTTMERPGTDTGAPYWTLAVKRGRSAS